MYVHVYIPITYMYIVDTSYLTGNCMYIVPIMLYVYMYLNQSLQLEEAEAEVRHAGLEEIS